MSSADAVSRARNYYDENTDRFLRFGQGGFTGAIHRSVWAPSVRSDREAFEYVDALVLEHLIPDPHDPDFHVLDLGCGVGASLQYLAQRTSGRGTGITISPVQVRLAQTRLCTAALQSRVRVIEGSYLDIPPEVGIADAAFSIEAFVHCPDPRAYFAQAAAHLSERGRLMIVDDFLSDTPPRCSRKTADRILREFREGWIAPSLLTPSEVASLAAAHGFTAIESIDLTPYLECGRPRDRVINAIVAVARYLPRRTAFLNNFVGGNALQQGLMKKVIEHRVMLFRKGPGVDSPVAT